MKNDNQRRRPQQQEVRQVDTAQQYEGDPQVPSRLPEPGEVVHATMLVDPRLIDQSPSNLKLCQVMVADVRDDGGIAGTLFGRPLMMRTSQGLTCVPDVGAVVGLRYSADASVVPSWRFTLRPMSRLN